MLAISRIDGFGNGFAATTDTTSNPENFSPLAQRVSGVRDPKNGGVVRPPWGLTVHTTGSGVTSTAKKTGRTPLQVAIDTYIDYQNGAAGFPWGGPGYVMDLDGKLYQIAPDNIMTYHAGPTTGNHRPSYVDGSWVEKVSRPTVTYWRKQWGKSHKHPYDLFPGTAPVNYIGLEIIPIGDGYGDVPMRSGLRFSKAQHDSVIALSRELAKRHNWPDGWSQTSRLIGHEDVEPIDRSNAEGGWDPGWLRASPYFDFKYVRDAIGKAVSPKDATGKPNTKTAWMVLGGLGIAATAIGILTVRASRRAGKGV